MPTSASMPSTPTPLPPTLTRWAEQIRTASDERKPLDIRGGATKSFYGEPAVPAADSLDTRDHAGIVSYEPTELVVVARAGTPLAELESLLAENGQCLPFEPPHFGIHATVGGMVAAGLSGPARASVGAVRDYVLGIEMLNGRGEHLVFGGQVMKNVAGYDVSRLLAGSLGSLGVITEVSLKVLPFSPAEATLCFELPQDKALAHLARWRSQPLPINASCWGRDDTATPARELLFVRLRGAVAAVQAAGQRMLADVPGEQIDNAQASLDWTDCREQTLSFFAQDPNPSMGLWRLSVPPTTAALDLPWHQLIEWHGGQRWVWAPDSAADLLRQTAHRAGGHATLFRAPIGSTIPRFTPPAAPLDTIQRRLKAEFDPAGIFNPGRWGSTL